MIKGLADKDYYYSRLQALHLTTLETRHIRGDLIKVFKIFKGYENMDS